MGGGTRSWSRCKAALVAGALILPLVAVSSSPAGPASASAVASTCLTKGEGGPFLRVCSTAVFSSTPDEIGAAADVQLPCGVSDLVKRRYVYPPAPTTTTTTSPITKKPPPPRPTSTTDEGYAYFAIYAPGDEMEVGFFHNANLPRAGYPYSLYVRHGKKGGASGPNFWNVALDKTVQCGQKAHLVVTLVFEQAHVIDITVTGELPTDSGYQDVYEFISRPALATIYATDLEQKTGARAFKAGTGAISPLVGPSWANGCATCTIAMITAVAQNGPGGITPKIPLEDGAKFGPVTWSKAELLTGDQQTSWAPAVTGGPPVVWQVGITEADASGPPPDYTVPQVSVPCKASPTGPDQWGCPPVTAAPASA